MVFTAEKAVPAALWFVVTAPAVILTKERIVCALEQTFCCSAHSIYS
jgi:hypothetical protein